MFEGSFRHLVLTVAQSVFAVSAAAQLLRVATKDLFGSFCVKDRAHPEKPLLAALRPIVISLINFLDTREMVHDHPYDSRAIIMARETTKTIKWAVFSPFLAAEWLSYDFARGKVLVFPTPGNIRVTVRGVQRQIELPVPSSVPWQPPPPT